MSLAACALRAFLIAVLMTWATLAPGTSAAASPRHVACQQLADHHDRAPQPCACLDHCLQAATFGDLPVIAAPVSVLRPLQILLPRASAASLERRPVSPPPKA